MVAVENRGGAPDLGFPPLVAPTARPFAAVVESGDAIHDQVLPPLFPPRAGT
jgi:hypothetical protein